jgi:hypothetical protein
MSNINIHHGKTLVKILSDKEIAKGDFCKMMGYSESNFSNTFAKERLPEKLIQRIRETAGIDIENYSESTYVVKERLADYGKGGEDPCKERLAEKERTILIQSEYIEVLKKQVLLLEKNQKF